MAIPSGLAAQIGYEIEVTPLTPITVTRFLPLVSESVNNQVARLESKGMIAGARTLRSQQWVPGNTTISGKVTHELYNLSIGKLLRAMFGGVVTAGAGPYTHTFTPGDLADDTLTMQIGKPDKSGTVQPFTYAGVVLPSWQISAAAGGLAMLELNVNGSVAETTGTALASASYASGIKPMSFIGASLSIAAAGVNCKQLTLTGDSGLDVSRRFLGSALPAQPLEANWRRFAGTAQCEFESLAQYNRFVGGTEAALVATFASAAQSLVITYNVRFDGDTPNVAGPGITQLNVPFVAVGPTTDAGAITAVWTTSESLP